MSNTTLQTEFYAPAPASFRTLITPEEYEKQGKEYTRQELKQASLYYQHVFHFCVLSATQKLAFLWTRKGLLSLGVALVVACLAITMSGESVVTSEGGSLVPATSFTQKVINLPYEFLDKVRQFTGQARKGLLLPEDAVFGRVDESNNTTLPSREGKSTTQQQTKPDQVPRQKAGKGTHDQEASNTEGTVASETALVDSASFSTFIQSQTSKGMDIFSFAFSVARDFAASLFSKAFGGWDSQNATTTPAPSSITP